MYSVVIAVEPGAPRFCQLVADREVGFPKKKGWALFQAAYESVHSGSDGGT